MTRRKLIRNTVLMLTMCVSLYQAARFFEVIDEARKPGAGADLSRLGVPLPKGIAEALQRASPAAAHAAMLQPGQQQTTNQAQPLVIIGAGGKELTPEEREELVRRAERMRPRPGGAAVPSPAAPPAASPGSKEEQKSTRPAAE